MYGTDSMGVRWRLFARDVISMKEDITGIFQFGSPPRAVRGLRLLGFVVYRCRESTAEDELAGIREKRNGRMGIGTACAGKRCPGSAGILGVDDGTGVVEVRLPLPLWESVALGDQVDVVGRPERAPSSTYLPRDQEIQQDSRVCILAEGCHIETDPNVTTLRALECIQLYKLCYFSRTWSPSSVTLPPLRQDPYGSPVDETSAATNVRHPCSPTSGSEQLDHGREHFRGTVSVQLPSDRDVGGPTDGIDGASGVSLEERLLAVISNPSVAGSGATSEQLHAALGVPLDDEGLASALAQMQLDGAIYVAGNRYMPL